MSSDHSILLRICVMSAWLKSKGRSSLKYEANEMAKAPQSLPFCCEPRITTKQRAKIHGGKNNNAGKNNSSSTSHENTQNR